MPLAESETMTPHQALAANGKSFNWARRFLGRRFLGRRFLGRRFLGRRFLGYCLFRGSGFLHRKEINMVGWLIKLNFVYNRLGCKCFGTSR